jgi:sulfur-carrier protein
MPRVSFTQNLQRHVACPPQVVAGDTVVAALVEVFARQPQLRDYLVDEHGALRKHMLIFLDGKLLQDRVKLSDVVSEQTEIYVMQALSGG